MLYSIVIYGEEAKVDGWTAEEEKAVMERHDEFRKRMVAAGQLGPVFRLNSHGTRTGTPVRGQKICHGRSLRRNQGTVVGNLRGGLPDLRRRRGRYGIVEFRHGGLRNHPHHMARPRDPSGCGAGRGEASSKVNQAAGSARPRVACVPGVGDSPDVVCVPDVACVLLGLLRPKLLRPPTIPPAIHRNVVNHHVAHFRQVGT